MHYNVVVSYSSCRIVMLTSVVNIAVLLDSCYILVNKITQNYRASLILYALLIKIFKKTIENII